VANEYTREEFVEFGRAGGKLGGKKGGKIGGKRRAKLLTPEERAAISLYAAQVRWNKYRAAHGLPVEQIEPPPAIHRATPRERPIQSRMKTQFEYKKHTVEIHRHYDEHGHNCVSLRINGVYFPYAWRDHKPRTPRQLAESLIDALPRGQKIELPPPSRPEPVAQTLRISNFSNAGGTR
jgi:hypothetical protein